VYSRALSDTEVLSRYRDMTLGLVGQWRFDEGSGTLAGGSSGHGDHGSIVGATYVAGESGTGVQLSGGSQYLSAGSGPSLNITGALSVDFWMKPVAIQDGGGVNKYDLNNQRSWSVYPRNDGAVVFRVSSDGTANTLVDLATNANAYTAGAWTHVVATYTPSASMKVYVNGVESANLTTGVPTSLYAAPTIPVYMGSYGQANGAPQTMFNGVLDEVRIYSRALSATEVASRYLDTSAGPVAEWRLEEGAGTVAHDTSGQASHGNMLPNPGGPSWGAGKWGKGLQFDGVDDYVDAGSPSSLDITGNQVTVEAWVKWNQPQTGYPGIVDKLYGGAYALKASGNTPYFYVVANGQEGRTEYTGGSGGDLAWHHIVGTYDGANMRLYVDGVLVNTQAHPAGGNITSTTASLVIGRRAVNTQFFNGSVDEARVYNRALSDTEVAARFQAAPEDNDTLHYYLGGKEVAFKKGGTLYFPLQDHLKGTAVITNSAGSVVESTTYYPYGQTRSGGITSTDRAFTGQRLDSTGLYYYGARYYDPNIGRFVSPDTIVQNYRRPASFNRYAYAFDNPLKYTDPSGHVNVSDVGGGGWRTPSTWDRIKHGAELAVDGAKSAAAGGVQFAATVTEVAVRVSQPVLQRVEPVANVVATVPEVVIEHTAVPVLNATGAGITNVELNPARGYVGVQVSEGGWVARTLEATTGGLAGAITLPVAGPSGSVVIVREELFTPEELETVTRHEEIHVTQQHMLGPLFLPLYFLGSAVHGYEDNPFEVQARSFSTPPPVNGVDIVYDEFA